MKNDMAQGLGKLGTQFFALMQMKGQEVLHFGELQSALHISLKQEENLLRQLVKKGYVLRLQRGIYLIPQKLPPGGHWQPSAYILIYHLMKLNNVNYYIGGSAAFHHYGLTEQVPNIITVYNEKFSGQKKLGKLVVQMIKISKDKIGLTKKIKLSEGVEINIATLARTIVDAVTDWSRYGTLPKAYEWINEYREDKKFLQELVNTTLLYGNMNAKRRIGFYLDKITHNEKLTKPLIGSIKPIQSWIPLVPYLGTRGTTYKKWRIIDNAGEPQK